MMMKMMMTTKEQWIEITMKDHLKTQVSNQAPHLDQNLPRAEKGGDGERGAANSVS
jgi:hypothetical protein